MIRARADGPAAGLLRPPSGSSPAALPGTPVDRAAKAGLEARNRALLEQDLFHGRLAFQSRPRVVELQLSNFCNMSCTMCYDGVNPPLRKLDETLVLELAEELFPSASVFVPFATSEPLILTWNLTRRLAEAYGIELELTTNVQFLDEAKFRELEPHVGVIAFSIDSHLPEVYESIRLNGDRAAVFKNLPVATRLCREAGIEAVTNVVFMSENAPQMDQTVAFLADQGIPSVHIQKLFFNKPGMESSDPAVRFGPEWIEALKERIRRVAAEKKIRVFLDFDHHELVDHLPADVTFRENRTRDLWLEKLRRHYPGYCPQSVYRLKVDTAGNAYPCCVGVGDRLKLGNLHEQDLEEVWNGPVNRDLRRAMLTQDLPVICRECNFRTAPIPGELPQLPFCDRHFIWLESHPERWTIDLVAPAHLARLEDPPHIEWKPPHEPVDHFEFVLSAGGENVDYVQVIPGDQSGFTVPSGVWNELVPFGGYWWTVWGIHETDRRRSLRGRALRCLIRHRHLPRIPDSTLVY